MYQNLFCSILICPLSIWQLGLNLECICLNAFPKSTVMALDELPRHIKVPQYRLLCPTLGDNKEKTGFQKNLFKCVTRPDLSGGSLMSVSVLILIVGWRTESE